MHTASENDALLNKWRELTAREKAGGIAAFLNEYGEQATWEEWLAFLREHQANGFEWTHPAD